MCYLEQDDYSIVEYSKQYPFFNSDTCFQNFTYFFEEFFSTDPSPGIDTQFHFGNFFINFFHKMDNKVNQFVPEHFFGMKIGNEETYIISFYFFPSQNHEIFSTSHHETSEFMAEQFFNFISLFNSNRHPNTVETKSNYLICSQFFSENTYTKFRQLLITKDLFTY